MPKTGSGRKSTITDHRLQIEKPMCSENTEKNRLRRATRRPVDAQNAGSSGRQSSIHRPPVRLMGGAVVGVVAGGGGGVEQAGGGGGCRPLGGGGDGGCVFRPPGAPGGGGGA